jgi:hypothetical protein
MKMNLKKVLALAAVGAMATIPLRAEVITFDEDFFGSVVSPDDPMDGVPYTMGNGVVVNFSNLNYWWPFPGTTPPNFDESGALYGAGGQAVIHFSQPVEVPSFWMGNSGDGDPSDDVVSFWLGGSLVSGPIASPVTDTGYPNSWVEVTAGTGLTIDEIRLGGDYLEGGLDGIEVVPEPSTLALLGLGISGLLISRKRN